MEEKDRNDSDIKAVNEKILLKITRIEGMIMMLRMQNKGDYEG